MDSDYEILLHGWTATETPVPETLDVFDHRCQTQRRAQEEDLLAQGTSYPETDGEEAFQQALGHILQDDICLLVDMQVAASWHSWSSNWGDEENDGNEEGFCYCLSPEKVCSMESISSAENVTNQSSDGGDFEGDFLSTGKYNDEEYSILSLESSPSLSPRLCSSGDLLWSTCNLAMSSPHPTRSPRVIDPEDPDEGEDLNISESERPGLRPIDFGFVRPRPRSAVPETRTEPITITIGNWKHHTTVTKPNADYRDVPSPIMLPGSPPQRACKPSLGRFCKVPSRRDPDPTGFVTHGLGITGGSRTNEQEHFSLPPSPALKIPANTVALINHPSNSDVSLLNLGSPIQSIPSSPTQNCNYRRYESTAPSQLAHNQAPFSSSSSRLLSRQHQPPRHEFVQPPVILSVEVPQGNELSWSSPVSPERRSEGSSPGGVFKLDEELVSLHSGLSSFSC